MGKISQVTSKYIINATIEIEGIVERPDVIGAVFGQTEGLLGTDLELRELQRSGRIGRIEVNLATKDGKTAGDIIIPSSLDKTETSIIAAAIEIIQRIGPCNAKVKVKGIEDVRINKRAFVLDRAKELLKDMVDGVIPDSQELTENVSESVKVQDVIEIGPDKLAAGPEVPESKEVIVVEGRADVVNLLRNGFQNAIAMNGTSVPQTIKDLSKDKEITAFVDGDRGGDLILRELLTVANVAFITKAPDGKEVEELTKKEIHKALRSKVPAEKVKKDYLVEHKSLRRKSLVSETPSEERPRSAERSSEREERRPMREERRPMREERRFERAPPRGRPVRLSASVKSTLKEHLDGLTGTRGALILDADLNTLGRVPLAELAKTIASLRGSTADTIVLDGAVEDDLVAAADEARIKTLVAAENRSTMGSRVRIITQENLA